MDPKLLTENGWKSMVSRFRIRDNGLQRALSAYERLDEEEFDERLEGITSVIQLAGGLKRDRAVAAAPPVVKYLTDLLSAAEAEKRVITKGKADASRAAATSQKTAQAEARRREQDQDDGEEDEEEREQGDYREKLLAAFRRLRSAPQLELNFIVCDARPQCAIMITKQRINTAHRAELTTVTGGGKRFLKEGKCHVETGKLVFDMVNPPAGLAAKLKKSFKYFTGMNVGVLVGDQSDEDDAEQPTTDTEPPASDSASAGRPDQPDLGEEERAEEEAVSAEERTTRLRTAPTSNSVRPGREAPIVDRRAERQEPAPENRPRGVGARLSAAASPPLGRATLESAPEVWHETRTLIEQKIEQLKQAILNEFADEEADLVDEIDQNMDRLDGILDNLDQRLGDSLARAQAASNPAARIAELNRSKNILADYIRYVKAEPLIAQIDSNPFGIRANLRQTLVERLTHMAQAIGTTHASNSTTTAAGRVDRMAA